MGRLQARLLRKEAGGQGQRAKRRAPVSPDSRPGDEGAPNLLARHLDVDVPDSAWVGAIT